MTEEGKRPEENGEPSSEAGEATVLPAETQQALSKLPAEDRRRIESSITALMTWGPMPNPIAAKMTSAHIDKALDLQSKEMQLTFDDRRHARDRSAVVFLLGLALLIALVIALAWMNRDTVLQWIVPALVGALGGFGGGYGWARSRN